AGVIVARTCRAVREGIEQVMRNPRPPQMVAATVERFSWAANAAALAAHYDAVA
ncbi:MAG TPA: glycoside hydrolase, partial [Erythrobacter sp.]|nr:glycoside hydrolase [Erythrobacter sp.]